MCFPECFLQGYDIQPDHTASVAVELGSPIFDDVLRFLNSVLPVIVFGLIKRADGFTYNSALAIQGGNVIDRYRKTHLLKREASLPANGTSGCLMAQQP